MKKKLLAILMAATMVLSLVACGGSEETAETPAAENAGEEAAEEATVDASDLKIGLVTDLGGVEDQSFNQSSWEGLQRAEADFGVEVNLLKNQVLYIRRGSQLPPERRQQVCEQV